VKLCTKSRKKPSLRVIGSRACVPDDRLGEAINVCVIPEAA
jgi:hypothetical protein